MNFNNNIKYLLRTYFKNSPALLSTYSKFNFIFISYRGLTHTGLEGLYDQLITNIISSGIKIKTHLSVQFVINYNKQLTLTLITKQLKKYLFCIDTLSKFTNKYLYAYVYCRFLKENWLGTKRFILYRRRRNKRSFIFKYKKAKILKEKRSAIISTNRGKLSITFSKRNMFINLSTSKNKTLFVTTLRSLGYRGRRRYEYLSFFSCIRIVKARLKRYNMGRVMIVYRGWHRFRVAIRNAFYKRGRFRVKVLFVKYSIKIPHNGCRFRKKKRKKRKKKA
jgi:ribosomal protein S11